MKINIVKLGLLMYFILGIFGCKKFITKDILGQYPETEFYKTKQQAILAINAAYQPLAFSHANNNRLWVFGDIASDDSENPIDQPDINLIDQFNITPLNGNLEIMWSLLYEGITRCNIVLKKVPPIDMEKQLQSRILSEAKFLRSWYYFELINIFGDVPVILEPLNSDQLQIAQTPLKEIFEKVIEPDLVDAALNLPDNYNASDVGRITAGAANALLVKAFIFQQKWDKAAALANKIVLSDHYSLMPVYSQNFNSKFKNNKESVFEVQHLTGQDPNIGNELNQLFAPHNEGGYFFNEPTQNFVDEFEKTPSGIFDPRLDYTVGRDSMPWYNGQLFSKAWAPATGYLTKKHQQPISEIPIPLKSDANINYVAIRYADVLLWYAEALNEQGRSSDALVQLNKIRKRARENYLFDISLPGFGNVPLNLLPNVSSINPADVRRAIQHERRVELGFEFHRYFDLIRWGPEYAKAAMSERRNFNYNIHKHFPIPQIERDRNKALH